MTTYQPQNLLVTGGAGFIGANFIRHLLTHNPHLQIVNLDKLTYAGSLTHLADLPHAKQHQFVQGDIGDAALVRDLLHQHAIDTIVHFAAESHVDRSIASPADFITTNVLGTFTLLAAAKQWWLDTKKFAAHQCRFHHISTDEVYGSLSKEAPAFTEQSPYSPRSPYSASKAGSDHLVWAYHHTYGMPITISLCSNNYGPYQHSEKFIPTVIRHALMQKPIPIYGAGHHIRDWLYVEDHCRGIWDVIVRGQIGNSYHLGGNNEWENYVLATTICQLLDDRYPRSSSYKDLLRFVPDRAGHDFRYAMDTHRIQQQLGWSAETSMLDGLSKTIDFYQRTLDTNSESPPQTID